LGTDARNAEIVDKEKESDSQKGVQSGECVVGHFACDENAAAVVVVVVVVVAD
jgi:hypothetical protein